MMNTNRREFIHSALLGGVVYGSAQLSAAPETKLGLPGQWPGRVIQVGHRTGRIITANGWNPLDGDGGPRSATQLGQQYLKWCLKIQPVAPRQQSKRRGDERLGQRRQVIPRRRFRG